MSLKRFLFGDDSTSSSSPSATQSATPVTTPPPSPNISTSPISPASEVLNPAVSAQTTEIAAPVDVPPASNIQTIGEDPIEATLPSANTPVHKMAASSSDSGNGSSVPYDKNISQAGRQAKLHATQSVAPEGTGASIPAELRAGLASTPSSSILDQAAAQNQFSNTPHFSSAGAQARAAAAGAAPAGTHSAHTGPAAVSGQIAPNVSAMTTAGVGVPGSTSNPTGTTGGAASQFPSNSPYQPIEPSTPQNAGFIHAFNTINELDDRSAPGMPQQAIPSQDFEQQTQQQNFEPPVQRSEPVIHALNTAAELDQPVQPTASTSNTNPAFSPAGYNARAAAAGTAPAGTVQPPNTPPSLRASYEAEMQYQPSSSPSEVAKHFSPAGYAAKQFATHTVAPDGTGSVGNNGARSPFQGATPTQGTIPTMPNVPGSDPNVSQAGLAARQGATQTTAPEGTGHWAKKSYSTMTAARTATGRTAMRVAARRPGPMVARMGAVGVAGLLHFVL